MSDSKSTALQYPLDPRWTLREVYLCYLIAIDNKKFLEENALNGQQVLAFRNVVNFTWQDLLDERSKGL